MRHWEQKRFPGPSRVNSAFPEWCDIIGGIVETAGFACPLDPSESSLAVDEDGEDMRELVQNMQPGFEFTFIQLATKCRDLGVFPLLTGDANGMTTAQRSAFGKLLGRYDARFVGDRRFRITGKGHQRRYRGEAKN